MSVPGRRIFESLYAGRPPWDIDGPQSAFRDIADQITGSLLDSGCGTGENALFFASRGVRVTGIDYLETPIAIARRKAIQRGLDANFLVMDGRDLSNLPGLYDTVIDSGLFHVFNDEDRSRYVQSVGAVLQPRGHFHVLCFSDEEPPGDGPRRVTRAEIETAFPTPSWSIQSIEPCRFDVRDDLKGVTFSPGGPKSWHATIRRGGPIA